MYPRGQTVMRSRQSTAPSRTLFLGLGCLAAFGLVGCSGLESVQRPDPETDPTRLYTDLTLDRRAINLSTVAPYNTLQLTATPHDAMGQPMTGLSAPIFHSSDTTSVTVTA